MFQLAAITLNILGSVLIYLSSRHQKMIKQRLSKEFLILGCLLILLSLWPLWAALHMPSALFIWLLISFTNLISIPFISLLKNSERPQ